MPRSPGGVRQRRQRVAPLLTRRREFQRIFGVPFAQGRHLLREPEHVPVRLEVARRAGGRRNPEPQARGGGGDGRRRRRSRRTFLRVLEKVDALLFGLLRVAFARRERRLDAQLREVREQKRLRRERVQLEERQERVVRVRARGPFPGPRRETQRRALSRRRRRRLRYEIARPEQRVRGKRVRRGFPRGRFFFVSR